MILLAIASSAASSAWNHGRDKHLVWLVHALVGGFALLLPPMTKMPQFKDLAHELRELQELIERACRGIDEYDTDYHFTG